MPNKYKYTYRSHSKYSPSAVVVSSTLLWFNTACNNLIKYDMNHNESRQASTTEQRLTHCNIDQLGNTLLHLAVKQNRVQDIPTLLLNLLTKYINKKNNDGYTALHIASKKGISKSLKH
ncbi:ankyrin repeat domain-containing protein [Cardinium endosymbiont of Bemisia tabaci]|uniref:ankyrin repeat domain-containing protein n=1 Tax=Cardinium endosymbiont of Bemisia tabaci TaxID=672794 RepID=UPI0013EE566F|nr:ankyrin repeat domain-containing protein [Cardinium endosymbiont of Bemisia tabaci]